MTKKPAIFRKKENMSQWKILIKFMFDLQVLSTNSFIVGHEVILSVQRLLKKYGKELQYTTWNCILDILESLLKIFEVILVLVL